MQQSPSSKVNSQSAGQEIPSFMEPEDSLSCSQHSPLDPILSQMDPVHTFPPYFPVIHSNIITPTSYN